MLRHRYDAGAQAHLGNAEQLRERIAGRYLVEEKGEDFTRFRISIVVALALEDQPRSACRGLLLIFLLACATNIACLLWSSRYWLCAAATCLRCCSED